jgi:rhodanese-related sulfurtransferase
MLASPGAAKPVLIDVRSPEEYAVSHIPGAVSAARFEQQVATLRRVGANRLVVLYCSVGWRSAQAAENLIKSGATNVRNLDGSIFEWANENRPLVDHANAPTAFVHPYNETWGRLLDAGHRAPLHS